MNDLISRENIEMKLMLNSPITEEQWDAITDVDFDHTSEIMFRTKHGKEVTFVKRPTGHWIEREETYGDLYYECSECKEPFVLIDGTPQDNLYNYCPNCGARMEGTDG